MRVCVCVCVRVRVCMYLSMIACAIACILVHLFPNSGRSLTKRLFHLISWRSRLSHGQLNPAARRRRANRSSGLLSSRLDGSFREEPNRRWSRQKLRALRRKCVWQPRRVDGLTPGSFCLRVPEPRTSPLVRPTSWWLLPCVGLTRLLVCGLAL